MHVMEDSIQEGQQATLEQDPEHEEEADLAKEAAEEQGQDCGPV